MGGYNALNHEEAEAGAVRLGSEERFEHLGELIGRDTTAIVAKNKFDRITTTARGDGEGPAIGHGVEGIADDVDDHTAELVAVEESCGEGVVALDEGNFAGFNFAVKELEGFIEEGIEVTEREVQ